MGLNVLIVALCLFVVPGILFEGWLYGGAPVAGLLFQLLWMSFLPILSMPVSINLANRLEEDGRQRLGTAVRFLPVPAFLLVGPLLAWITKFVGLWIMGR